MASNALPPWLDAQLPSAAELESRLKQLIELQVDPEGWARRKMAGRALFVMLYGYAIEGAEVWVRPGAITDMSDAQAEKLEPDVRRAWLRQVQGSKRPRSIPGRWYNENSRESIRDETLRRMIELGIVVERPGLSTTSPQPRYALARDVLPLCEPEVAPAVLAQRIADWRASHLSTAALARLALLRQGASADGERVLVSLPSGEVRQLAAGASSELTKSVVEVFGPRFLVKPAVVLISESARKIRYEDEALLHHARLEIGAVDTLPDVILLDVGVNPALVVFVECVASAGAVNEARREALAAIAKAGGYGAEECAFVTAFKDRATSLFKAMSTAIAWGSFVWFASEPEHLVFLRDGHEKPAVTLASLMRGSSTG